MKFNYKIAIYALALMLTFVSCSDNDNWEPGPEAPAGCMTVYFEPISKYSIFLLPTDSHILPFTISRAEYDEAADVPLEIKSCPEGASVPGYISFLAGQKSVTFDVDLTNTPSGTSGILSLAIDTTYVSPYGAGLSELNCNISIGDWEVVADNVRYKFDSTYSGSFYTSIETLRGTGIFRIPDFLNSGSDLMFNLVPEEGDPETYDVVPYQNFVWYTEDDPLDGWYFYDATKATYPTMYPKEGAPAISYACFWGDGYDVFNFNGGTDGWGSFTSFIATLDDGTEPYLTITFSKINLIFDPFE